MSDRDFWMMIREGIAMLYAVETDRQRKGALKLMLDAISDRLGMREPRKARFLGEPDP